MSNLINRAKDMISGGKEEKHGHASTGTGAAGSNPLSSLMGGSPAAGQHAQPQGNLLNQGIDAVQHQANLGVPQNLAVDQAQQQYLGAKPQGVGGLVNTLTGQPSGGAHPTGTGSSGLGGVLGNLTK